MCTESRLQIHDSQRHSRVAMLKCVMLFAAPCTTTVACRCLIDNFDSANRDVNIVIPWPHDECNQCQLVDTVNECAPETAMDTRTAQYRFGHLLMLALMRAHSQ